MTCQILPHSHYEDIVKISCTAYIVDERCGKRQCRSKTRQQIIKTLENESTEQFRAKRAAMMMEEGDTSEPPLLYSATVLRMAKYQHVQSKYKDPNPMIALQKFKRSPGGRNVIRDIHLDPVAVLFWSPHQVRVYNNLAKRPDACLCIDATGGVAKQVIHVDNSKSKHIFLYFAVLFCSVGRVTVSSMFSESQDTVRINTWLRRWIQSGAQFPKEVVSNEQQGFILKTNVRYSKYFRCVTRPELY